MTFTSSYINTHGVESLRSFGYKGQILVISKLGAVRYIFSVLVLLIPFAIAAY